MSQDQIASSPTNMREIKNDQLFFTPKKPKHNTHEQTTSSQELITTSDNPFTPQYAINNQTTSNTSPFYKKANQNISWKTPAPSALMKTNPFLTSSNHANTPHLHTPVSPYSDRYIPFRQEKVSRNLFEVHNSDAIIPFEIGTAPQSIEQEELQKRSKKYQSLLQENILDIKPEEESKGHKQPSILQFKNPTRQNPQLKSITSLVNSCEKIQNQKIIRKIDHTPAKVLDAPGLLDDFYQDVLHWGKSNLIAVGLTHSVYLYNFNNGSVIPVPTQQVQETQYTSLQWNSTGQLLCLGNQIGGVMIYDAAAERFYLDQPHQLCQKRIGSISWANQNVFACGSKDRSVTISDIRIKNMVVNRFENAHSQEVCSLVFSENENMLASGGNDNKVHIWSLSGGLSNTVPDANDFNQHYLQWTIRDHKAAIRALAWNPHANGILASGGGSADKSIRIFSTTTNTMVQCVEVDSQVCKILFSRNTNELISTHGYERNQIMVWQYPQLKRITCLEGHSERVLYASLSPDQTTLVSGSGDETLKFWNIFPQSDKYQSNREGLKITDFR